MTKKLLLLFCLLLLLPQCCSAGTYQITETELTILETNLDKLQSINNQLSHDLKLSKAELTAVLSELETLKKELTSLRAQSSVAKNELLQAQDLLQSANRLLDKYEREVKRKQTIYNVAICLLIVGLCVK